MLPLDRSVICSIRTFKLLLKDQRFFSAIIPHGVTVACGEIRELVFGGWLSGLGGSMFSQTVQIAQPLSFPCGHQVSSLCFTAPPTTTTDCPGRGGPLRVAAVVGLGGLNLPLVLFRLREPPCWEQSERWKLLELSGRAEGGVWTVDLLYYYFSNMNLLLV